MDELTQYYYSIYPGLVSAMEAEGIDPRWAGIVAPQVMIETSWGKSPATKYHNYFGMKAAKNQNGVIFSTNEGYGDDTIRIRDNFLAFPSREEGLRQGVRRLRDKFNAFEGKPSTEQYVKNINSNPEQIYFTGNPEDYVNNINSIKNGSRAKAAIKQYAKDVKNTFLEAHSTIPNPSDATRVAKPQPIFTPRGDVKKAMQDKVDFHNFMNSISIQNNPQPVYNPPMKFDEGGKISDSQYYSIMEKVAEDNYKKWGFNTSDEALTHALNDNTYNYRGFYNKYPHSEANADTHWTDEFKTVWHPTFSDESIYSGNKSQFNPQGIQGGHWFGDTFIPSVSQISEQNKFNNGGDLTSPKLWNDLSMAEKADMMKVAILNGITTLPEIRDRYNEFAKGGYAPSENIKRKIEKYEGKAMTGAIDPLNGKWAKNNSFESEAKGFYNALPEDIRDQVLSNPELADSLYSYSYNVGAGNFKKRVVPTLRRYYQGNATVSDIEKSMWASGDSKLRGLQRRRAEERAGVRSALAGNNSIYPTVSSDSESLPFTPFYNEIFNTPLSSYNVPTVTLPIEEPLVQAAEDYAYSKEALDRQERQDRLNAFNMLLSMSNPNSSGNSLMDTIGMLTGRNFAQGGNLFDGTSRQSQQMIIGNNYWKQQANKPTWYDTLNPIINGGTLPEIIVTPTNDENWLFSKGKYQRNSRKPLADTYTSKVVANYLSRFENENAEDYNARISRLADAIFTTNGVMFQKNNVKEGKHKGRAHYNANTDIAKIDNMDDIFSELAHPYQSWLGNNRKGDEISKDYDNDRDPRGGTRYAYPDTYEGETHGFFEPALKEWIETGKIGRSLPILDKRLSNQKIIPKNVREVTDSAASWNKQSIDNRIISMPSQLPLSKRIQYSIFDYPLLDKKKSYGGNIYDGLTQNNQQMSNPLKSNIFRRSDGSISKE